MNGWKHWSRSMRLKWSTKGSMGLSFARVLTGARESKVRSLGSALAAIAAAIVWISTARADDLLDRPVSFHVAPAPLASALIEFSSQSGVQVAAADVDVSRLNSNGVNGTLPIRAALSTLLRGSGLDYSRVGKETVAIRTASMAPALATAAFASGAGTAPGTQAREPGQPAPDVQPKGTPDLLEVAVKAPRPPTAGELAGDSLHQFIVHHATVHYANYGIGNLAHWHGGKQSICPRTVGIGPAADAFVTARIRAVAAYGMRPPPGFALLQRRRLQGQFRRFADRCFVCRRANAPGCRCHSSRSARWRDAL